MPITYKEAGVDTHAGQDFVKGIKNLARKTQGPEVLSGIGGFAALYKAPFAKYKDPVLVSGTDGVGTKIHLALELNNHKGIGQDLVAMCLNDILTTGARPLFFLDYMVTQKLKPKSHLQIIKSMADACRKSGMALIGGETAEHPGSREDHFYDLAGFAVGIVEREKILPKKNILPGDMILGFPSSGIHSNGFSLVRKIISIKNLDLTATYPGFKKSLGDTLLEPTRLYHDILPPLADKGFIKAACHITGGGFYENIPRILPDKTQARINCDKIPFQPVFAFLEKEGPVAKKEMFSTFNMGCGLVLIAAKDKIKNIQSQFPKIFILGEIAGNKKKTPQVFINSIDF
jgi:phosphoribosylformylglycinamidine cyclo-ligase